MLTTDGRRTKCDQNSSPCTSCTGELKNFIQFDLVFDPYSNYTSNITKYHLDKYSYQISSWWNNHCILWRVKQDFSSMRPSDLISINVFFPVSYHIISLNYINIVNKIQFSFCFHFSTLLTIICFRFQNMFSSTLCGKDQLSYSRWCNTLDITLNT